MLITRSCCLVKQAYVRLCEHPSRAFQVLFEPQSNILLYRYIPKLFRHKKSLADKQNDIINLFVTKIHKIHSSSTESRGFTSRTSVRFKGLNTMAFRLVISNPLTQWSHIENVINDQLKIAQKLEEEDKEFCAIFSDHLLSKQNHKLWPGWPFDL